MRKTCPACRSPLVSIVYGFPTGESVAAAEAGELALGGCLVGWDDPLASCTGCGASVWPDGTYLLDDVRSVVLVHRRSGPEAAHIDAHIHADGRLDLAARHAGQTIELRWGSGDLERYTTIRPPERTVVLLMLCIERFASADDLTGFCVSKGLRVEGDATGDISRFTTDADGTLTAIADGTLQLPVESVDRFTLAVLADLWRRRRFATDWDVRDWLTDHDIAFGSFAA